MPPFMRSLLSVVIGALLLSACASWRAPASAGCNSLHFDLTRGTLNGLAPTASASDIKGRLPCFAGETPEGDERLNWGGGVFFLNHQVYFYTHQDWIEVRTGFRGKVTPALLDAPRSAVVEALGQPVRSLPESESLLFSASYGCIQIFLDAAGRASTLAAHSRACENVIDAIRTPAT